LEKDEAPKLCDFIPVRNMLLLPALLLGMVWSNIRSHKNVVVGPPFEWTAPPHSPAKRCDSASQNQPDATKQGEYGQYIYQ